MQDPSAATDSMAQRLSKQRQQRSMLRTSNLPLEEAAETTTPAVASSELHILREEMKTSDATISRLQTQLKDSEAEMEEMGSRTARLAEELRAMRERADVQLSAGAPAATDAAEDGPMQVSISLPEGSTNPMENLSVSIRISTSPSGEALVMVS